MKGSFFQSIANFLKVYRFSTLLLALLLLIFLTPHLINFQFGNEILGVLLTLILLLVVFTLVKKRIYFVIACFLSLFIISDYYVLLYFQPPFIKITQMAALIIFYGLAIVIIFRKIMESRKISHDSVLGALSVYLLLALSYGTAYVMVEYLAPGSFSYAHTVMPHLEQFNLIYFSFTTLTTVGFGDVVAISVYAKSIVILEEITGVLYLAAIVSRLVASLK